IVRYTAAEPTQWLNSARTLRQAAHDLWEAGNAHAKNPGSELGTLAVNSWTAPGYVAPEMGGSTRDVCFMLFGFALENLVKGIIICRDPKRVTKRQLAKWYGARTGHELDKLYDEARIPLTDLQRAVLVRTSRLTAWKGRYPVPKIFGVARAQDRMI